MKRLLSGVLILAFASVSAAAAATCNLVVTVQTPAGAPIPGASVVALYFNNGQPDTVGSRAVIGTDASGQAAFCGAGALVSGNMYQIVASSNGFAPSIVDQFNNGLTQSLMAGTPVVQASAPTRTITLDSSGVSNVGVINANVVAGSLNSIVFGQVGLQSGGGSVAYGFAVTNGAGAGVMSFDNVAFADAGTYQVSAFDPKKNRSASQPVTLPLGAAFGGASQITVAGNLDFTNAPPPVANISQNQQNGQNGNLSLSGVVVDTNSAPIPHMQLNFQSQFRDSYGQTFNDWRGAQTDQNGVFQLYDLHSGSTYYASIFGGCSFDNNGGGNCYQGTQSTANASGNFSAAPGVNDFLFVSSLATPSPTITLKLMPPGNGTMAVYVKDQFGNPFPQAGVGLWPDGMPWKTTGGNTCANGPIPSNPGFKNTNTQAATGYALITGLPSGNYGLNVWTPYGQTSFNGGADGQQSYSGCGTPGGSASGSAADDRRLTIDTTSANGMIGVYDIYGNIISSGMPALTVTVTVSTGGTGVIKGTLSFPSASNDLSASPISLVVYPQCTTGPCGGGGYTGFSSSATPQTVNYSIAVSSGQKYWVNILSNYWGPVFAGGNQVQPDLTVSTVAVMNIQFGRAGRIVGVLRKPDGSIYVPPSGNGAPWINAQGNNSWGGTQLNTDGSFAIGGLLPGDYTLSVQNNGGGSFPYTAKQPAPKIHVTVLQDTAQDLSMADAVTVRPSVNLASLPPMNIVDCSSLGNGDHGDCPPQNWKVFGMAAGTPFTSAAASSILASDGGENPNVIAYSPSTGQNSRCNGTNLLQPGFCTKAIAASKSGSAMDFYLLRSGGFDSGNLAGGVRPYFVVEKSSSFVVGPTFTNATVWSPNGGPGGSTTTVQDLPLTPTPSLAAVPQAVLAGTVTAVNMINQRQFQELAGNFDGFLKYLPIVWAYDSSGTLKGAGLVVPFPPNEQGHDDQLKKSVGAGDFAAFQNLTNTTSGWGALGYEIRGLTAGKTYNLVVTTPNYPPFKTSVTLGVAGSTTSLDVNLDANPGVAISGLVQSTSAAAIAGAQVVVKADGYPATTLTTSNSGAWSLDGLGAGRYQVTAVAAGYAQQQQNVDVSGTAPIVVPTFSLAATNASITGTVYTNNPVCPAGASCSAFGKTVLQGITVRAYDDTVNTNNPTAALPLYRAVTDSSGTYRIDGLVTGDALGQHVYKFFVDAPGYYVSIATAGAVVGTLTGVDFALKPKPLDVSVYGHPVGNFFEFQITNYQKFSSGKAYISAAPFAGVLAAGTTDVSTTPGFVKRPDAQGVDQLFLDYPLASLTAGVNYVLHIEAQPNDPRAAKVIKEIPFGLSKPHGTCQAIDEALIGDDSDVNAQGLAKNQAPLDISGGAEGNGSGLSLPAGALIPSVSTAIPSMCMNETDASAAPQANLGLRTSGVSLASFLSGVYNVTLSSVSYNQKGVDLTLSYKQTGTSLTDAAIFYFDNATLKWKSVPGVQTIDPVRGTISVKGLKSLSSVLDVRGAQAKGLMSISDGRSYRPTGATLTDSGLFAILKPSQVSGGAFTGTIVKVYNFPNPFNLQTKSVALNNTAGICSGGTGPIVTDGTVIKYEIPSGISGTGVIRIYTTSGRLVREVDAGNIQPSSCYYTVWDGKNSSGLPVANGVYYGVLSVGGSKQSSGTFKLAVIK